MEGFRGFFRVPAMSAQHSVVRGGILITFAFFCIASMCALVKVSAEIPVGIIVFFENILGFIVLGSWSITYDRQSIRTSRLGMHILRAVTGVLSQALMFIALKRMPLMNAVLLGNAAPLFIPLCAWIALKERIAPGVWLSLLIGFAGVACILHPGRDLFASPWAMLALSAALFSAIALVAVNRLTHTETTTQILFFYFFLSSLVTLPFAIVAWRPFTAAEMRDLFVIGVLMTAAQVLFLLAYHHATASQIAPFNYSVVVFSGLFGWVLWKDVPGWTSLVGVLLVSLGGILATHQKGASAPAGHLGWTMQGHRLTRAAE